MVGPSRVRLQEWKTSMSILRWTCRIWFSISGRKGSSVARVRWIWEKHDRNSGIEEKFGGTWGGLVFRAPVKRGWRLMTAGKRETAWEFFQLSYRGWTKTKLAWELMSWEFMKLVDLVLQSANPLAVSNARQLSRAVKRPKLSSTLIKIWTNSNFVRVDERLRSNPSESSFD